MNNKLTTLFLFVFLAAHVSFAQQERSVLDQAVLKTHSDIEEAAAELNQLRDRLQSERKPLAERHAVLLSEVKALRVKSERAEMIRRQGGIDLDDLTEQVNQQEEEVRFIESLMSEYRRSFEARTTRGEALHYAGALADIDSALSSDSQNDLPRAVGLVLDLALRSNYGRFGGMLFEGTALDEGGVEHKGVFAVLGPLGYFADESNKVAGLAVTRLGSANVSIRALPGDYSSESVWALVSGKDAAVPVDVTSGDALKIAESKPSLAAHMKAGGFVMIPLMLIGIIALVLVLKKLAGIRKLTVVSNDGIDRIMQLLDSGDIEGARSSALKIGNPLSEIISEGIRHKDATREQIEEILHEHILARVPLFEKHLGTLAVLGGVSPLLGLLGTVTGMIHTFRLVTIFGSGDARLLSGGISEALVTTEFGLVIAIPVLLVHAYFSRRVKTMIGVLEYTVVDFVNKLKMGE